MASARHRPAQTRADSRRPQVFVAGTKDEPRLAVEFAEVVRGPHGSHVQVQRQTAGPGRGQRGAWRGLPVQWHWLSSSFLGGRPHANRPRLLLSFRHPRRFFRRGRGGLLLLDGFFLLHRLEFRELLGSLLAQISASFFRAATDPILQIFPLIFRCGFLLLRQVQYGELLQAAIQLGAERDTFRSWLRFSEVEGRVSISSFGVGLQLL